MISKNNAILFLVFLVSLLISQSVFAMEVADTIEDLQQIEATDGMLIEVSGYHEANDGGGGTFLFDASSSEWADRGMIIRSSKTREGRWLRQKEDGEAINIKWYGARGDGESDEYTSIDSAISYFFSREKEGTIFFPEGTYRISWNLALYEGVSLLGEGMDLSVIKNTGLGYTRNSFINTTHHHSDDRNLGMKLSDLTIDVDMYNIGNWIGGIWIEEPFRNLTIERVRLTNSGGNIIRLMKDSLIVDSIFDNMDGRAISTGWERRPDLRFRNNEIRNNQFIRTAVSPTGPGINLSRAEDNIIVDNELININPPGDTYGGIRLPNDSHNNLIAGNTVKNFPRGIWVMSGSQNNEVRGNTIIDSWIVALFMNNSHERNIPTSDNIFADNKVIQENPALLDNGVPALIHLHEDFTYMLINNSVIGNEMIISEAYRDALDRDKRGRQHGAEYIDEYIYLSNGSQVDDRNNQVYDNIVTIIED
ncbi:glycosyl hydrolase family 28-related protein [Natronospora cellulosivora (SeqCode)]